MLSCHVVRMFTCVWFLLVYIFGIVKITWAGRDVARREKKMQRSVAAHRKQALTYVEAHSFFGGGGGRGVELRDSTELWGEGCDHSVIEYYCHNAHSHTHTAKVHTTANVYKHIHSEMQVCDILRQPLCTQTRTSPYTCTPVTAAPLGGALWGLPFSVPAPVTWIMHKKWNEHVNLCSPPHCFSLSFHSQACQASQLW